MKNDYNVSVSASGGPAARKYKSKEDSSDDDESSATYSQSATITNSVDKKLLNFEALKKKYLANANSLGEEDEDEDDSSDLSDSKK